MRKVRGGSQDHAAGTERPANISTVGSAVGTDVRPPVSVKPLLIKEHRAVWWACGWAKEPALLPASRPGA